RAARTVESKNAKKTCRPKVEEHPEEIEAITKPNRRAPCETLLPAEQGSHASTVNITPAGTTSGTDRKSKTRVPSRQGKCQASDDWRGRSAASRRNRPRRRARLLLSA